MSEMLDRVANEIGCVFGDAPPEKVLRAAQAAIEAMREPSQKMLDAALHDYIGYERTGPRKPPWNGTTMWKAMIDAALRRS